MGDDSKKYSGSLAAILERKIRNVLMDVHVSMPAKITRYDYEKQQADCKPSIKRRFRDGTSQTLPVIPNVPVVFPRVNNSYVYFPLAVGDNVLLVFSDYSLDNWAFSNQEVDPEDVRAHNITDAFALVGGYDFNHPITDLANADDLIIKNNTVKITVKPNGTMSIVGTDGVDLVDEAHKLAEAGEAATVSVVTTPITGTPWSTRHNADLNNKSTFTAIKTALAKIKV